MISMQLCASQQISVCFVISKAMHKGYTVDQIHDLTKIDKWFLEKLKHIIDIDEAMKKCNINTMNRICPHR